jgi:excisionase family DNA binding protein
VKLSEDEFLTVADVATILRLNQMTVRNWIDQGYLPAFRVGRRIRILRSDLEQFLERSRTQAPVAQPLQPDLEAEGSAPPAVPSDEG